MRGIPLLFVFTVSVYALIGMGGFGLIFTHTVAKTRSE